MGPHSFERGNSARCQIPHGREWASMGPHSFERGNAWATDDGTPAQLLQWGLTHSSEETQGEAISFGARGMLQWGLTHSSEETKLRAELPFELHQLQWGLTHSSEETHEAAAGCRPIFLASMGPHSFERGNMSFGARSVGMMSGFNGASLIRARKPYNAKDG